MQNGSGCYEHLKSNFFIEFAHCKAILNCKLRQTTASQSQRELAGTVVVLININLK